MQSCVAFGCKFITKLNCKSLEHDIVTQNNYEVLLLPWNIILSLQSFKCLLVYLLYLSYYIFYGDVGNIP